MAGTGIRNSHRIGDYLMRDDESGFVEYRSSMLKIWNGTWRHKNMFETRQPQEFVQARSDPRAMRHIRPEFITDVPVNSVSGFVGETDVPTPTSPAGHLFKPGIGKMVIESTNSNAIFEVS